MNYEIEFWAFLFLVKVDNFWVFYWSDVNLELVIRIRIMSVDCLLDKKGFSMINIHVLMIFFVCFQFHLTFWIKEWDTSPLCSTFVRSSVCTPLQWNIDSGIKHVSSWRSSIRRHAGDRPCVRQIVSVHSESSVCGIHSVFVSLGLHVWSCTCHVSSPLSYVSSPLCRVSSPSRRASSPSQRASPPRVRFHRTYVLCTLNLSLLLDFLTVYVEYNCIM